MKIKVRFTSDEALGDALCQASVEKAGPMDGATPLEQALAQEKAADSIYSELQRRWLHGHCDELIVEFDLEAGTATVLGKK